MKIKITADSTCDLSQELIEKYNIGILPLCVIMGENTFHDGIDVKPADIFGFVAKTGVLPKTSAPSVEEYKNFFEENLKGYDALIHYNISAYST